MLMLNFVKYAGIPFPNINNMIATLAVSTLFLFFCLVVVSMMILGPAFYGFVEWKNRYSLIFSLRFAKILGRGSRSTSRKLRNAFVLIYSTLFFMPMVILLGVFVWSVWGNPGKESYAYVYLGFGVGLPMGIFSINQGLSSKGKVSEYLKFQATFFYINTFSLSWAFMLIMYMLHLDIFSKEVVSDDAYARPIVILMAVICLVMHIALSRFRASLKSISLSFGILCLLVLMAQGMDRVSVLLLKVVNVGGGLPASLLLRDSPEEPQDGCLVLDAGEEFYWMPAFDGEHKCPRVESFFEKEVKRIQGIPLEIPAKFVGVRRFRSADASYTLSEERD